VLSASFIPVYAALLGRREEKHATHGADVVGTLLLLVTAVLVVLGVPTTTPLLIDAIAPGFSGEKRAATIRLVRILFPGVGLLVLSSWCLGILNSHRRFFLSYAAPVVWSATMIAAMLALGNGAASYRLAEIVAWAATLGAFLQFRRAAADGAVAARPGARGARSRVDARASGLPQLRPGGDRARRRADQRLRRVDKKH
jgi:putative peptidoglycan lipid II flippase